MPRPQELKVLCEDKGVEGRKKGAHGSPGNAYIENGGLHEREEMRIYVLGQKYYSWKGRICFWSKEKGKRTETIGGKGRAATPLKNDE